MSFQHVPYEQLIAYAARELSDADFAPQMAHLRECPECLATIKRFRAILYVVRDDFIPTPPASAIARAKSVFNSTAVTPMPSGGLLRRFAWMPALRRLSFSMAITFVLIMVSFILGGISALAARDAIPGDVLYPVKISVEALQINATADPVRQAELRMFLLDKRTDEIAQLVELGRTVDVAQGAATLESQMTQTLALMEQISQRDPARGQMLGDEINQILTFNEQKLKNVSAAAPTNAQPALQKALRAMEQNQVTIKERAIPERPTPTPTPAPLRTPTATPHPLQMSGDASSARSTQNAGATRDATDKDNNKDKAKDETARETKEPRPKADATPTAFVGDAKDATPNPSANAPGQNKSDAPGNSDKDKNPPGQDKNNPAEPPKPPKSK